MNILVIAPHMDDELLGLGGTLRRHVKTGDKVSVCIVAHRVYNRQYDPKLNKQERKSTLEAQKIIGYKELRFLDLPDERLDNCLQDILIPLEEYYNSVSPDLVYLNFWEDNHQDHRAVFQTARILLRRCSSSPPGKVLVYETPSSTEQSPSLPASAFMPNYYVNIESAIECKLKALECYERESRTFPHPRSLEAIRNLAIRRGVESGFAYAEAFIVLYDQWD
jgi:LmbE family N-acetylglucosaminyl deacetylase